MRRAFPAMILLVLACGGEQGGQSAPNPPEGGASAPAAAPAPGRPTGTVHEVRMDLVNGKYLFEPASLTIKPGDAVRWINARGAPHNVQFKKDRIPAGAQEILNAAMPGRTADLTGPFLIDTTATYEVSFANAPAGAYGYVCQPHEALGMVATLTVRP